MNQVCLLLNDGITIGVFDSKKLAETKAIEELNGRMADEYEWRLEVDQEDTKNWELYFKRQDDEWYHTGGSVHIQIWEIESMIVNIKPATRA